MKIETLRGVYPELIEGLRVTRSKLICVTQNRMYAYREKPKFSTPGPFESHPKPDESLGCGWSLLLIIIAYLVLSAIFRVTNGYGNKLDQILCYGTLIIFVILMLWGARDLANDSLALGEEKQQWKNACKSADLTIVNRSPGGEWDDGYRFHYAHPRLELEMNVDQKAVSPNYATVSVEIWESLYKKLETQNSVRIYYKPEAPLTFLLEEET